MYHHSHHHLRFYVHVACHTLIIYNDAFTSVYWCTWCRFCKMRWSSTIFKFEHVTVERYHAASKHAMQRWWQWQFSITIFSMKGEHSTPRWEPASKNFEKRLFFSKRMWKSMTQFFLIWVFMTWTRLFFLWSLNVKKISLWLWI